MPTLTTANMIPINNKALKVCFPYPKLMVCSDEPTYDGMQIIQQQANQNVLANLSPYGGGQKGHLGLMMQDNFYFSCYSHHFIIPANPGPKPAISNGTSMQN